MMIRPAGGAVELMHIDGSADGHRKLEEYCQRAELPIRSSTSEQPGQGADAASDRPDFSEVTESATALVRA
jgi:hypothetical protein